MKNKYVSRVMLCILLFSLVPTVTADELSYDSVPPYSNGMMISKTYDYGVRVRFEPTTPVIGGTLQQVKIYWCDICTDKTGMFSISVYECDDQGNEGNKSQFNSTVPSQFGAFQSIDVSSLGFVVTLNDFCVEVRSQQEDLFVSMGGDNSNIDRSYHYGYPATYSWTSFDIIQSHYIPEVRELAIRANISTEPTPTTTTTTTSITTTTTLRRPSGGGPTGRVTTGGIGRNCFDDIQNCHHGDCEEGIDCGGPCDPCMNCSDGIQNQGEEGIDCGGPCEKPCPVIKVNVTTTTTTTTVPTIETTTTTTTTTTTIEVPGVVGRVVAFPPEGIGALALLILLLLLLFLFYKRKKKKEEKGGLKK